MAVAAANNAGRQCVYIVVMKPNNPIKQKLAMGFTLALALCSHNSNAQGWYRQYGGSVTETNKVYASSVNDSFGARVTSSGTYTLTNSRITTTGNTSNADSSGRSGLNAGVLVDGNSTATFNYDTVLTNGRGASGVFCLGAGSTITASNCTISTIGRLARGVDATYGATINLTNVKVATLNDSSAAIAADWAGGNVTFTDGVATTTGSQSAGVYSTDSIAIISSRVTASNYHAAVTDLNGKLAISNSTLTGGRNALAVYRSTSGSYTSTVSFTGDTLNANGGHIVYDTAANLNVTFNGKDSVHLSSGNLIYTCGGGTVQATMKRERLTGNIYADATSSITALLEDTTALSATVTNASMSLDATSRWTLTAHSHIITLANTTGVNLTALTVSNITGNGFNVYYSTTSNSWLAGKKYALVNGGCLLPEGAVCPSAVEAISAEAQLTVYPNPAYDELIVDIPPSAASAAYHVLQPDGREVLNGIFKPGLATIDVASLSPGVYLLSVTFTDGVQVTKFIKQ